MKDFLNLDVYKNRCREYYDSGEYSEQIQNALIPAAEHLNKYIGQQMIAVCLDIDETMTSEWGLMQKYDFGWFDLSLDESNLETNFPPIPDVLDFFNNCKFNYVDVFIVTAKRQKYSEFAIKMLNNAGYAGWTGIYFMDNDDTRTIENYKIATRDKIRANGYNIILNIGDQYTDLSYPKGELCIKLPNPFYLITSEM
jgi:predicted secreted acid phosphatase